MDGHSTLSLSLSRFPRVQRGFTLIEIAIVLVVIGLLIGGVLTARSMIDSAKISKQIQQLQQFDIATQNFKSNFMKLPGEMASRESQYKKSAVWGVDGMTDAVGNNRYDTGCCVNNPGGDFRLGYSEAIFAFIDLHRVRMISENFTANPGTAQDGSGHGSVNGYGTGSYLPASKLTYGSRPGGIIPISNARGDVFWFVAMSPASGVSSTAYLYYNGPGIIPVDALALDSKLDDGVPSTGGVVAVANGPVTTDADYYPLPVDTGACVSGGGYNVSVSTLQCSVLVKANLY